MNKHPSNSTTNSINHAINAINAINVNIYQYSELTTSQLYQILMARSAVFVVEQNCVYQDIDGMDDRCLHIIIDNEKGQLMAYCRIIPNEDVSGINTGFENKQDIERETTQDIAIGRVLVMPEFRNQGLATKLMTYAIEHCHQNHTRKDEKQAIKISAQCYLINFYQSLGFTIISEPYLEDGIEHIDMRLVVTYS